MSKQLQDLLQDFTDMSEEDQLEHIRQIRKNRMEEKPSTQKRKAKTKMSQQKKAATKAKNLASQLTPEERAKLIKELTGG